MGAILGGATPGQFVALKDYGQNIGLAFQMRDDILDASEDKGEKTAARPNSVSFLGMEGSRNRLESYVRTALSKLDEAAFKSDELCYLARRLLEY